ncbi:MAG: PAS domain-containing protein [Puia sp.]|nr:PAS domain-containing protein [Puia sp.]
MILLVAIALAWLVVQEIAQRKQSEKKLKQYVELIEYTRVVIRNMNDEIIFRNKGMGKLYGWSLEEVLGRTTHELFQTVFPQPFGEI